MEESNTQTRPRATPVRVLLVDDQASVRLLLISLLEDVADIQIVGEATNGSEAVRLTRQLRPDVVLMDIHMPIMNGIDATRLIHAEHPAVRVIGLSTSDEEELIAALRDAGAVAYVQKGPSLGNLVAAIRGEREV